MAKWRIVSVNHLAFINGGNKKKGFVVFLGVIIAMGNYFVKFRAKEWKNKPNEEELDVKVEALCQEWAK